MSFVKFTVMFGLILVMWFVAIKIYYTINRSAGVFLRVRCNEGKFPLWLWIFGISVFVEIVMIFIETIVVLVFLFKI